MIQRIPHLTLAILALSITLDGQAHADIDQPIPPVPAVTGQRGRIAQRKLLEWQGMFSGTGCVFLKHEYRASLDRLAVELTKIPEDQDRTKLQSFLQQEVLPRVALQEREVPGLGTHAELDAKRQASVDWLASHVPDPSRATDAAGITAYVAQRKAYLARAAEDHALAAKLLAVSPCHKFHFNGFTAWESQTRERELLAKLDPALAQTLPQVGLPNGKNGYTRYKRGDLKPGLAHVGDVLYDTVSIRAEAVKAAPTIALARQWASALEGPVAAQLAADVEAIDAQVKDMESVYAKLLPTIAAPAGKRATGAAAAAVKKLGPALVVRITSPLTAVKQTVTENVTVGGKTGRMTFPLDYDTVSFSTVVKGAPYPWWTDMPGVSLSELCTVSHHMATFYRKGRNRTLGKWLFASEIDAPMLCKNKDAIYKE